MKKTTFHLVLFTTLSLSHPVIGFASIFDDFFKTSKVQESKDKRLSEWRALIVDAKKDNLWQQLNRVNQFFNKVRHVEDAEQWGIEDYWATPVELLSANAGDCEDFAIAKFVTLKALGLNEAQLRISHVTINSTGQAHMVLLFQEKSGELLVLDNRKNLIKPLAKTEDLTPIYSFNNSNLWVSVTQTEMSKTGDPSQIKLWLGLNERLSKE